MMGDSIILSRPSLKYVASNFSIGSVIMSAKYGALEPQKR